MPSTKNATDAVLKELRAFGLAYPGAHTKSPWPGHLDLAVKDKTFAYMSLEGEPLAISCKLPHSSAVALMLPFTKPTAYGLGKSGWVSASFDGSRVPPVEMLKAWIDESYRAQAPKKLVAGLPATGGSVAPAKPATSSVRAAKPKLAAATKTSPAKRKAASASPKAKAAAGKKTGRAKKR